MATKVGGDGRKRKLLYCLGQAARILTVRVLSAATSVSIQQDGLVKHKTYVSKYGSMFFYPIFSDVLLWQSKPWIQDARKNCLALRYAACSEQTLKAEGGVVGVINMAEEQDFTAVGVKNACVKVIKELCVGDGTVPYSVAWLEFWTGIVSLFGNCEVHIHKSHFSHRCNDSFNMFNFLFCLGVQSLT